MIIKLPPSWERSLRTEMDALFPTAHPGRWLGARQVVVFTNYLLPCRNESQILPGRKEQVV